MATVLPREIMRPAAGITAITTMRLYRIFARTQSQIFLLAYSFHFLLRFDANACITYVIIIASFYDL